jgi:hypothetical protein
MIISVAPLAKLETIVEAVSELAADQFDCRVPQLETTMIDAKMAISLTPKYVFWVRRKGTMFRSG